MLLVVPKKFVFSDLQSRTLMQIPIAHDFSRLCQEEL